MMYDIKPEDRDRIEAAIARITPKIPAEFAGMAKPMMESTFTSIVQVNGPAALDQLMLDLEKVQVAITTRDIDVITEVSARYNVPSEYIGMIAGLLAQAETNDTEEVGDGSLEKENPDYMQGVSWAVPGYK